jgi:cytochrome c-type biogenesis protein CcmE
VHAQRRRRLDRTIIVMALITVITIIIVIFLMTSIVTALITPGARAHGAGGSCVGK